MVLTKTPSFRLDGRRALATGTGCGIGLAAASALADAGAHVALAARTATEIAEAANAIRARRQQVDPLTLDVRGRGSGENNYRRAELRRTSRKPKTSCTDPSVENQMRKVAFWAHEPTFAVATYGSFHRLRERPLGAQSCQHSRGCGYA